LRRRLAADQPGVAGLGDDWNSALVGDGEQARDLGRRARAHDEGGRPVKDVARLDQPWRHVHRVAQGMGWAHDGGETVEPLL
jgi:hypothetical protein